MPEDSDLERLKNEFLKSHIDYFDSYRLTKKLFNKDSYNKFQTAVDFNIRKIKPKSLALVSFLRMMDSFYRRFLSITQFITNKKLSALSISQKDQLSRTKDLFLRLNNTREFKSLFPSVSKVEVIKN